MMNFESTQTEENHIQRAVNHRLDATAFVEKKEDLYEQVALEFSMPFR